MTRQELQSQAREPLSQMVSELSAGPRLQVEGLPPKMLFYCTVTPFLLFYALFAFVLFPLAPILHYPSILAGLEDALPQGLGGLVSALQQWVYSLFFVGEWSRQLYWQWTMAPGRGAYVDQVVTGSAHSPSTGLEADAAG